MKFMQVVLSSVLFFSMQALAQSPSALQSMVQTEQAFSRMAEEKNIRDAFMAFIADDGLLFRPDAVNGKKWMLEHPVPPSDKRPLLAWQPSFAGMAAAGDLGFTTGPWEFKNDIKDAKPSGYGHFVTLWKKQTDGTWKFVVDLGITHPQSGGPQNLWRPTEKKTKPGASLIVATSTPEVLLDIDRKFADAVAKQGLLEGFRAYASPDIRLYRNGSLPFIGFQSSSNAFASAKGQFTWEPVGGDVSRSGDLGYTHGAYEITGAEADKKVIEQGSYLRIWRNDHGSWRVVLEVTNPR